MLFFVRCPRSLWHYATLISSFNNNQCFFVTVRAGTAYRKIWRLVNNFFACITRFTVQKFQLFWVIFCIIIFFSWIMAHFNFVISQNAKSGCPVFTLIATGWRYRKIFFYKKALVMAVAYCLVCCGQVWSSGRIAHIPLYYVPRTLIARSQDVPFVKQLPVAAALFTT